MNTNIIKSRMLFLIACFFLLFFCSKDGCCQVSVSIYPGIKFNSLKIGYSLDKRFAPFVGLQYMKAKYTYIETGKIYDWEKKRFVDGKEIIQFEGNVIVPNLGIKISLLGNDNLKTHLNLSVLKPFSAGGFKKIGYANNAFDKDLNNLNIWGVEAGFGAEYYLSSRFCFGGEYGLRNFFMNYSNNEIRRVLNNHTQEFENVLFNSIIRSNINPTYFRVSLSYYF